MITARIRGDIFVGDSLRDLAQQAYGDTAVVRYGLRGNKVIKAIYVGEFEAAEIDVLSVIDGDFSIIYN